MKLLFQLLLDVQECDTKVLWLSIVTVSHDYHIVSHDIQMRVLNVLSLLMDRMGASIRPHISALLQYMPQLWAESAQQQNSSMLRCVILTTLTNIVKGLGPLSSGLHSFILPVIQLATDSKTVRDCQ